VIISFTVGVSLSALIHAAFTVTVGGVALAVTIVCFNAFLIVWFFVPTLVARRAKPLDRWWASLLMLLLALGLVVWLVIWGVK